MTTTQYPVTEIPATEIQPMVTASVHLMLRDGRLPSVRVVTTGQLVQLRLTTDHHPADVGVTLSSPNPADIEQVLLTALAALRQHTTPIPNPGIEAARVELGTRAATGSPVPELEPTGVGA